MMMVRGDCALSIEGFLAANLIADFALLGCVSRTMGLFNWRKVLAADALCAALALLSAIKPTTVWFVALASPALAALIVTRGAAPRLWSVFALTLAGQALVCGGLARLLPVSRAISAPLCLSAGTLMTLLTGVGRPPGSSDWQVSLCLTGNGRRVRFPALIDTGNRLREPVSGLPVLIAEAPLIQAILPQEGCRTLRFGAVGGEGRMTCFRPDALWIGSGHSRRRGPDIWVAVAPGPLPGLCQALAPPELASYYST